MLRLERKDINIIREESLNHQEPNMVLSDPYLKCVMCNDTLNSENMGKEMINQNGLSFTCNKKSCFQLLVKRSKIDVWHK